MAEARIRRVPISYLVTLLAGVVLGFLLAEFGEDLVRYPVETVLVAVLAGSIAVLAWACRELLRDLVRRGGKREDGPGSVLGEPGRQPAGAGCPQLSPPHPDCPHPNGVRH